MSLHKRGLAERDGLQTGKEVMELEVNCLYLRFLKLHNMRVLQLLHAMHGSRMSLLMRF